MAIWLDTRDADFCARFDALVTARRGDAQNVDRAVATIIEDVRKSGDEALCALTARFDRLALVPGTLRLSAQEIDAAAGQTPSGVRLALQKAAVRIESFHKRHLPQDDFYTDESGLELGARWTPLASVGIYVPGGTAAYPSSVLMNAIPARVAGVSRIAMVTPSPDGRLNPAVLAAAHLCGITEIYRIGGAQAVAALAFGTQSIAPVDKITGPGNAYVAEAKRQVHGQVGIDSIAGPSEVVILADGANDPAWLAADLMAQAEHDEAAQSILITDDATLARRIVAEIDRVLPSLPRQKIAEASWRQHGAIIHVRSLEEAPALIDRLAPEHLQIATVSPEIWAKRVRHAGAIFLGALTPEALGDYCAGPNHVLPTARSARFSSGLSVLDFMKRTTIIRATKDALHALGPIAGTLAVAEGLDAHALSIRIRTNQ